MGWTGHTADITKPTRLTPKRTWRSRPLAIRWGSAGKFHLARERRKLAAILAADVVGYSRLIRPTLENILRRHAKHDLTDRLVVQYAPLALLRDRVDVAQTAFERIFLEHRHRAAIVKQRIDDLP